MFAVSVGDVRTTRPGFLQPRGYKEPGGGRHVTEQQIPNRAGRRKNTHICAQSSAQHGTARMHVLCTVMRVVARCSHGNRKREARYYMIMNMLQPKALYQWFSQWRAQAKMNHLISIKFFHMFQNDMNDCVAVLGFMLFLKNKKQKKHLTV